MATTPVTLDFSKAIPIGGDPVDPQASALQGSVAYGAQQDPDQYAKLLKLQKQTGLGPEITKDRQQQVQQGADVNSIDYPKFAANHPRTTGWASNPDNAAVAGVDEIGRLAQIEQQRNKITQKNEYVSLLARGEGAFTNAFLPFIDAAGVALQGSGETAKALLDKAAYGDMVDLGQSMRDIWTAPRTFAVQKYLTQPVRDYFARQTIQGPQEYIQDPNTGGVTKNPEYKWWGRGLVNTLEEVPGSLAAFALTGKLAGGAASAAGVDTAGAGVEGIAGARASTLEAKTVPAILGTQAAQGTYADARSKGADQRTAMLAAIEAGISNYALMGEMPGAVPTATMRGTVGQWAGRSAAFGTTMAAADNAIAKTYDPNRGILDNLPQSIATMAAFEGVGALSNMVDLAADSKLRARSPEKFQEAMTAILGDDPSLRIPVDQFNSYFTGKEMNPQAVAAELGSTNYTEAHLAGGDVEVPTENFLAKLDPEHQKALLPDIVDPRLGRTVRQDAEYRKEMADFQATGGAEKLMGEFAAADAETQANPEWQNVKSEFKQRLLDRGDSDAEAEHGAALHANAVAYFAKEGRMTPDELVALKYPNVVRGEAPQLEAAPGANGDTPAAPALFQGEPEQRRGWMRQLPDGRYEIGKTPIGDVSQLVHEPSHIYLQKFAELTGREGASDVLQSDFKKLCEWLGTTPEEVHKNGFTPEQHEQWAKGTERFVREGNAPTAGLRRAFHTFSVWLTSLYRRASDLGVEISDEVRGVMGRMYAGEDAVNRAGRDAGEPPRFQSAEEAGWTEEEFKNYADAHDMSVVEAKTEVTRELHAAAERERTQSWREEYNTVRDAVTAQVDARPEYTAMRSLRRGATDDGTELKLNRDELVKQFGEERVKALNKLHRGLYRNEGGTDAETAAEILGYPSGEEMMKALETTPRRAQAIAAATEEQMTARHGDIRYDGTLDWKARLAKENNERAAGSYRELKALRARVAVLEGRAADQKTAMRSIETAPLEHYREVARQMIQQKSIADLQPGRYLDASRIFSRESFDALRKGDVRRAAEAKGKELLNHFLFREASAARDYADKFENYIKRVQSVGIQQRLGLGGINAENGGRVGDYREQFNWLLARHNAGPQVKAPERSLQAWADDLEGQGFEVAIAPEILDESRFVDYRKLPLSEVQDLHDALINVRTAAMKEFKMFVQGKLVDFTEAKQGLITSARTNLRVKPESTFEENRSVMDKLAGGLHYVDSRLIRMERLMEWLDGGKTGPWHDNVWNLASDAQGDEYKLQAEFTRTVTDALNDMPDEMRRRLWTEKVNVEGVGEPLTRRRMLAIAFNMGNEGNLDRLTKTFTDKGWDPAAIRTIGGKLTREEWEFVQKTWNSLKPLGARANELQKRLTGLPLTMVEVVPFKVALEDGTDMDLGGGYYPIVMDPRHSQRAIEQDAKQSAQNAMQSGYARATTSKGYTKARTGYGGQLLLDYEQALSSHVAKVAKDISHREFMLSTQRLLLDTEVRKALRETLGPAYEQQFMPWLRTIINDNNGSVQERMDGLKDAMQKLRGNVVAASLGFNFSTSLLQISHAPRMLLYARTGSLAQALVDFLAHPVETTREIHALSPNEMRFRGDNLDRDVRGVLQQPAYQGGYSRKVALAARFGLQVMDHLLSHTLWKAAYRDGLDKYADLPVDQAQKKAVYDADSAVRLGLGTSAPKDLPAIMRGNEFNKFITTLYGFHNGVYNQLRDIGHQFRYDSNVGKLTYAAILTAMLPAVLGSWLTGQGPDKDENPGWWAAKRALIFSADSVPIVRSIASSLERGSDVQFSPIENVMTKGAKVLLESSSAKEDKDWLGIGIDAGEAAGALGGVPGSHQAAKIARYWHRAEQGKIENPNVYRAVVGGR